MRDAEALLDRTREYAAGLAKERSIRQRRRSLDPADFSALRAIGLHLASVPVGFGGLWEGTQRSIRTLCDAYRILAGADASLALSSSMHPSVLAQWRDPPPPVSGLDEWEAQRRRVFATVLEGAWWGTVISEPGSGGDVANTRSIARKDGSIYRLTGEKHFGSGSGATSYMLTSARPAGEAEPAFFFLDVRDVPWDGSKGMKLVAEWDGHGMAATNSHGFSFVDFPATRVAWPEPGIGLFQLVGGTNSIAYVSVIVGVVEAAIKYAREYLLRRGSPDALRPFEKVEWVGAHREAWLLQQAFEGALQALERKGRAGHEVALAKANIAVLAESVLTRLCRIIGGGVYARHSPLGFWFEDVRAMGFLRPPWALASDALFNMSWAEPDLS